jgi:predicted nucleotidyltransferase
MKSISIKGGTISVSSIVKEIFNIIPKEDIVNIYLFGSVVKPTYKEITKTRYVGWFQTEDYKVNALVEPKDIDVLIIVKDNCQERDFIWDAQVHVSIYGNYGLEWSGFENRSGLLHIITAKQTKFEKALEEKNKDALSINENKICIY